MHVLRMSYGFVTILVQKNYITLQLRYDTLPFFDSYRTYAKISEIDRIQLLPAQV